MANNYLRFSFMINNVSDAGWKWLKEAKEEIENEEDFSLGVEFELETTEHMQGVWVYAEEYGDPDLLTDILSEYLVKFDPSGTIAFTWASTCSKMRLDEFSGGGAIIWADRVEFMSADRWIEENKYV